MSKKLKQLQIGDSLYARHLKFSDDKFTDKIFTALVTSVGRKYITFDIAHTTYKCEVSEELPYIKAGNYDYCLFESEEQFNSYLEALEQRRNLARFFTHDNKLRTLTDDQVREINKIIGI